SEAARRKGCMVHLKSDDDDWLSARKGGALAFQHSWRTSQRAADWSPQSISCCSTMLYTLALRRVKTRLVLRSSSRRPSRMSVLGRAERLSRRDGSYTKKNRSALLFVTSRRG